MLTNYTQVNCSSLHADISKVLAAATSKAAARREPQKPATKVPPKGAAKRKQPDSKGVWHVTQSMHATQTARLPWGFLSTVLMPARHLFALILSQACVFRIAYSV
mgnify:FL=1